MSKKHNRFRSEMPKEQVDLLRGTEIKEKRTKFGKVYALGGNRFQAVTYTEPVHRYNEETKAWEEIDNRFAATPRMMAAKAAWKQGIMPAVESGEALLECNTDSLNVECAMAGEVPFITLTDKQGRKLRWGIEGAASILPDAVENADTSADNVRSMRENVFNRLHGEVVYGGIFAGVDLRCKLGRSFKDELIFAEDDSVRPVTFLLESEGRAMCLTPENALVITDENGSVVFRLQAPYLLDANDRCGNVTVALEERTNGVYAMTYTPDAAFAENAAFPVVLDPAVETTSAESGIVDTFVSEKLPGDYSALSRLYICDDAAGYGICNTYMRVTELPKLGTNHYITGAFLCVRNYASVTAETTLVMREVLGDWDVDTLTYANQPAYSALYQDSCVFPAKHTASDYTYLDYVWREMDVTSLARKWYLGDNKGVVFTPAPTTPNAVQLHSSEGEYPPYFVLNYASLAGLESYLTYDSQPAGLAGTSSVSLVNGNLIFTHGDTAMNGSRMPVSVSHVYNSCDADKDEFGLGHGWRTTLHHTLHKEFLNDEVMYVYTDGDGTEHWFELDEEAETTQYVDLSGLSLTLTVAEDGVITITSKGDARMVFPAIAAVPDADAPVTSKVLIQSSHDAVGNQIAVTPVEGKPLLVQSVTDGAGRVTTFDYDADFTRVTAIRTPWQTAADCVRFEYADGCLTKITHEDDRVSTYAYEIRNGYRLLKSTGAADGTAVSYAYSNTGAVDGLPHCITGAVVTGAKDDTTLKAIDVAYEYGNHLTLVKDNISGKAIRYHFNDNGNQVSVDDELGFAAYTRYDQTGDNENAPINHATARSQMQRTVRNLLQNTMFENGTSPWESSDGSGVAGEAAVHQWGIYCRKITATSAGRSLRQAVTLPLERTRSYTLSGYLRGSAKGFLRVSYTVNGETHTFDSDPMVSYAVTSGKPFQRLAVSFTLPEGADAQVYCEAVSQGSSGYVWATCMQMEEGLTCNHFNLLQDQGFASITTDSDATACWCIQGSTLNESVALKPLSECAVAPPALLAGSAVHLQAHYDPDHSLCVEQEFSTYGHKGDRFTVGGWCSAFAKKHAPDAGVFCSIDVMFPYSSTDWVSGGRAVFNYEEGSWQFASGSVIAPHDFTKVLVRINMTGQINYADVAGVYLYPESFGTDYVYDAKGNAVSAKHAFGGASAAEYDDHDNPTSYTAPGHTLSSTFNYGATDEEQKRHLLLDSLSPLGTKTAYAYNTHGGVTQTEISAEDAADFIRSTAAYTTDDNYIATQTDARAKSVATVTDPDKGTTTSVTDPKGQKVDYEYDSLRRVNKVSASAGEKAYRNEYVYDGKTGQLTGVKHNTDDAAENDVSYTFEYDALGRKTRVKVGEATLSENVYQNDPTQPNYGTLTQMRYGNGMTVRNEYDDFNRVTGVTYGDEPTPRYEYAYNARGQVAHVRNNQLDQVVESEYDLSGRPCRVKTHRAGKHVHTGEVVYDDVFGRLSEFQEKVGESRTEYATTFGYDEENRPVTLGYGDYGQSTLTYDQLGRVRQSSVKAGSGAAMTTTYAFEAGGHGENSTTGLVKAISQTGGSFAYTYDDNGNIASVVQDGVTTSYTYDALGQLVRVDDGQEGATWEYEYDQGGNILSKKKYVDGVLVDSKTFTYGNPNWRDQLTAVNGVAITYDASGNPLYDGEWTYTWQNGRQLARMQKDGVDASFVYNENGLRVQKTVNGVVTDYTLHGKNIVHLTCGSDELHFFYDAKGKPAVVVFNGTAYSYVKNLQGDIVAILDSTGAVVVSYVYDAWGKPIATTGTMAATLGALNPFAYRSYVLDRETGLYYLRYRYYATGSCRFISADTYLGQLSKLFSHTLFSYCRNAPVSKADPSGHESSNVDDTNYGAAQEYVYCDDPNINCLAYVLGESIRRNLWTINGNFDVYNVGNCLVTELTEAGYSIRRIDTYDSAIDMDEYRIALRTTKPIDITILGFQIYSKSGDFHLMVQHNDGSWSHKPGWAPSMVLNEDNPSDATWPYYREKNGEVKQFIFWETYGSDTLYFAIKRPVEE